LERKACNSPIWNDLLSVKDTYVLGRKMAVGKGEATSFWFDKWYGDFSLKDKFPLLSEINNEQKTTVARMASSGWRLTFRWWLNENLQSQLRKLKDLLTSFAVK